MKKIKIIFPSILAILMSASLIGGATYSLFTSTSKTDISVTAGKVIVESFIDESTFALESLDVPMTGTTFANGGTANVVDGKVVVNNMTPGDKVSFNINIVNTSNVTIKYKVKLNGPTEPNVLFDKLVCDTCTEPWATLQPHPSGTETITKKVVISMPKEVGDNTKDPTAQGLTCDLSVVVEAVQGNAKVQ